MPRKKKLTEDEKKQLLILESTYKMHVATREDVALRGKKETVERMDLMINDLINQMNKISPEFAQKCVKDNQTPEKMSGIDQIVNTDYDIDSVYDALTKMDYENGYNEKVDAMSDNTEESFYDKIDNPDANLYDLADSVVDSFEQNAIVTEEVVASNDMIYNNVDPNAQYDLIKLPSKGECYKHKISQVPVGYLTAADENLLTSPNLYESGSVSDVLLKKKILNKNINIDELVAGDVDAIMVFLRGTSYGNLFPITATDPLTKKQVKTDVDLQQLTYKPFNLKSDENGYFDYELPLTKHKLKFRFLTKKDEKLLQKLNKKEGVGIAGFELGEAIEKIKNALKADNTLSDADKGVILDANKKLEKWSDNLKRANKTAPWTKLITNAMEMEIVSVDGETDRKEIHEFVMNMPASDSLAFRRYIYDNQPGVNFEVDVERPESDGGGSFKCFLEWDDSIFWNIA